MTNEIVKAITGILPNGSLQVCMVTQTTPLRVSFDGGSTDVPGDKILGLTYSVSIVNNARAFMDSPNRPLIFPIG